MAGAAGPGPASGARPQATHPIDSHVVTTAERTVVPIPPPPDAETFLPYEVEKYAPNGYGRWEYGPGAPHERRLELLPGGTTSVPGEGGHRLVRFFTITDIHLTDKESPAQAILIGFRGGSPLAICAYSMVMLYTTHVLDAAVQTINALHADDAFDFGLALGDSANNTQRNELRWFIDTLDGKLIVPATGLDGGSVPADAQPYQQPFQAAGLDPTIPWYQAIGNHDQFWMGVMPADDNLRETYVGTDILDMGDIFSDPAGTASRGFYMGSLDCSTPTGTIIGIGPEADFPEPPQIATAADPHRHTLAKHEWIAEFLDSTSRPDGHGFTREMADAEWANHSFRPRADVPVKVIALDDTQRTTDPNIVGLGGYGHGSLTRERFDWLIAELDAGQADDELMVIAAHIPIGIDEPGGFVNWSSASEVSEAELIAMLHEYPNLVLWVAGHRHLDAVTALPSPDPDRPELGLWEVETFSLRDFPQQFRTFDLVLNDDGTLSIFATDVDPAVAPGSPAEVSRGYSVASQQIFGTDPDDPHGRTPYNAELLLPLTPTMQAKLRAA